MKDRSFFIFFLSLYFLLFLLSINKESFYKPPPPPPSPVSGTSIVGYDWCYPSCDEDGLSSFKFSSDGTFTFSTKTFGGISRRGTWRDLGNGNIQTNDNQVGTQTVRILSRTRIKVGSTTYNRD